VKRRVTDEQALADWPPEHLRHFRLEDWPGKVDPKLKPLAVDCARCAFEDARAVWGAQNDRDESSPIDWVLRCCPAWPDCHAPDPAGHFEQQADGRTRWIEHPPPPGHYHWHQELI
jgi:hypothetical protein